MSVLICENISKTTNKTDIIKNFSYNFLENQIYSILGKTDSGQQDLLELISGKTKSTEGIVYLDGIDINKGSKINEKICYVANDTHFSHYINVIDILKANGKILPKLGYLLCFWIIKSLWD